MTNQWHKNFVLDNVFTCCFFFFLKDGDTALTWAAKNGYEEVVKMLIDVGADLKVPDEVSS